jgi:undecaprenyl diphosphate synthase
MIRHRLNHLAVIPDGNRRWARAKNLPTFEGHRRGFEVAHKIAKYVHSKGIHTFTIWAFSTENWKRTKDEVGYLMRLYAEMTDKYLKDAIKNNVRIIHLGRRDRLPGYLLKKIEHAENKTKKNTSNVLNIALDYGGRDEIIRSIKQMYAKNFNIKSLSEDNFNDFLDTSSQPHPEPDLILRTSGEMRVSGLFIWQAAYSELLFINKHFPDLTYKDIDAAIAEFQKRQRRFGK